jgi:NADH-quinone oxidoreductase subunit M
MIVLGIYGFTLIVTSGAVYQILSHEIVDAALFVLLGLLYDRYATSQIASYGGAATRLPRTATMFVLITLAMVGLPILSGFVGEFMILSSTFAGVSRGWAVAATLGVILGATYMLSLVQKLFYGPESAFFAAHPAEDLQLRELVVLWPVAILTLVLGVAPSIWLPAIESGVRNSQAGPAEHILYLTLPPPASPTTIAAGGQR